MPILIPRFRGGGILGFLRRGGECADLRGFFVKRGGGSRGGVAQNCQYFVSHIRGRVRTIVTNLK